MDGYSGKRAGGRFGIAGRGSGLSFRNASHHDDQSVHCNRLVCSNRLNFMKSPQVGNTDRDKSSSSFRASDKKIVGSSSKAYSSVTSNTKTHSESQGASSHKGISSSGTGSIQCEKVNLDPSSSTARLQMKIPASEDVECGVSEGSDDTYGELESLRPTSRMKSQKTFRRQSGQGKQESSLGPSTRHSFGPRNIGQAAKSTSYLQSFNASRSFSSSTSSSSSSSSSSPVTPRTTRYGLKNLGCTSITDVLPPGCSSSDSSHNEKVEMTKRSHDGEYSSARRKTLNASVSAGTSGSRKNSLMGRSLSLSERPTQPASRRTRYWVPSKNGVTSVRTRRTNNEDSSRSRVSEQDNSISRCEAPVEVRRHQNDESFSDSSSSVSQHFLPEPPVIGQSSCIQLGSRNEHMRSSSSAHPHDGSARPFSGLSIDRDGYQRYNRDGIAEVLLALERMEQDEELSYEQLLVLETNLFLSGLGFRDQHRDMRLDIDNMSYEELLALGDKMGTVSTGLTEEQLLTSVKRNFYIHAPPNKGIGCGSDDFKCSICQEEYAGGDERGTLHCDHHYHLVCIQQWLRLKNWCPICKANATVS